MRTPISIELDWAPFPGTEDDSGRGLNPLDCCRSFPCRPPMGGAPRIEGVVGRGDAGLEEGRENMWLLDVRCWEL